MRIPRQIPMIGMMIASIALVPCGACGGVDGTIELRIVTAETFDLTTGVGLGDSSSEPLTVEAPFSGEFYVQARITGDDTATGLVTFDGQLRDDGSGSWSAAFLTATEWNGFATPGLAPSGQRGLYPAYLRGPQGRLDDHAANGVLDPVTGDWSFFAG